MPRQQVPYLSMDLNVHRLAVSHTKSGNLGPSFWDLSFGRQGPSPGLSSLPFWDFLLNLFPTIALVPWPVALFSRLGFLVVHNGLRFIRRRPSLDLPLGNPLPAHPTISSYFPLIDARRRLVQAVRGKHLCRCMPQSRARPISGFSLRKPLPRPLRGGRPLLKPPCCRQSSQCRRPLRTSHGVSSHLDIAGPRKANFPDSPEDAVALYIDHDTRIQILESVSHLPKADKEQCGAFLVRFPVKFQHPIIHFKSSATSAS